MKRTQSQSSPISSRLHPHGCCDITNLRPTQLYHLVDRGQRSITSQQSSKAVACQGQEAYHVVPWTHNLQPQKTPKLVTPPKLVTSIKLQENQNHFSSHTVIHVIFSILHRVLEPSNPKRSVPKQFTGKSESLLLPLFFHPSLFVTLMRYSEFREVMAASFCKTTK